MSGLSHQEAPSAPGSEQPSYLDQPPLCRASFSLVRDERIPHRRQAAIERVVELDIIPRLLATYRSRGVRAGPAPKAPPPVRPVLGHSLEDAVALAQGTLGPKPEETVAQAIARLIASGSAAEVSCLELIADAARHLGQLWVEDRASFAEVTLGMFHLQKMVHDIAPMTRRRVAPVGTDPKTFLLLGLEGEQHCLAQTILANCFDCGGWQVTSHQVSGPEDVAGLVSQVDYDVVGFSVANDGLLSRADQCIRTVRQASRNPRVVVMVGGSLIIATPSLVERLGADGTAASAAAAVPRAEQLLNQVRRPEASSCSAVR